jgi:hypothetical protein
MRSTITQLFGGTAALALLLAGGPMLLSPSRAVAQDAPAATPAAAAAPAQQGAEITEDNVITGTMDIQFATRTQLDSSGDLKEGSAAIGAQDKYTIDLAVAKTTKFTGSITRQPNLYTSTLQRKKQSAQLGFDIGLAVLNPKDLTQKKDVGKWVGLVPIDEKSGAYDLAGGRAQERPLRISVDAIGRASAFQDQFAGRLLGKAEKKEGLAAYTYKRMVGNKEVAVTVKRSDPLRFDQVELAKGPVEIYPHTFVNGRLDYDYETGNWLTDGINFRYTLDGKEYTDVVTGTIKWVEDPQRKTNGKGYYEFNLRFNEEKSKKAGGESAAFDKMSEEDAFFAVDNSIPSLTGKIAYVDQMISGKDAPSSSKVTYNLNANKLTKQQVMNFFKLWVLCTGPANYE